MTFPPSLQKAAWNDEAVRVEGSRKTLAITRCYKINQTLRSYVQNIASALLRNQLLHTGGNSKNLLHILLGEVLHRNHVLSLPGRVIVLHITSTSAISHRHCIATDFLESSNSNVLFPLSSEQCCTVCMLQCIIEKEHGRSRLLTLRGRIHARGSMDPIFTMSLGS